MGRDASQDAARFVWWFTRSARLSRSLDQWRIAIDEAMHAERGPEETRLLRQLQASIDFLKRKERARLDGD